MKIRDKEKTLLIVVGSILVCFIYYNFVFVKHNESIELLKSDKEEINRRYNEIENSIKNADKKREELKTLKAEAIDISKSFYEELKQEEIIWELDILLTENLVNGSMSFSETVVEAIDTSLTSKVEASKSTLNDLVNDYNGEDTEKSVEVSGSSIESNSDVNENKEIESEEEATDEVITAENSGLTQNTVEKITVTLNFNGSYSDVINLLKDIQEQEKNVVISAVTMGQTEGEEVSGTATLDYYGIPKIKDAQSKVDIWPKEIVYGKEIPFSTNQATGNVKSTKEGISDFAMIVKPYNSEMPTVTIGKYEDYSRESYIYSDSEEVQEVGIILTKEDNKYYYQYIVGSKSYPNKTNIIGEEFEPNGKNIMFEIASENRLDNNDISGVKVKISNNTDLKSTVIVTNDDKLRPRIAIENESNSDNLEVINK